MRIISLNKKILDCFIYIFIFLVAIYAVISIYRIIAGFTPDYSIFYHSTKDLITHSNPYKDKKLFTVYNYPPITNILFIPFVYLPYYYSQLIFVLLSFTSIFLIVHFALKILNFQTSIKYYLLIVGLYFITFPVKFTLGMGQINLIAYVLLLSGFYYYIQLRYKTSCLLLFFAVLLKPILVLTFLLFILRKKWLTLKYLIIFGICSILISILLGQLKLDFYYFNNVIIKLIFATGNTGSVVYYNQGLLAFLSRILNNLTAVRYIYSISVIFSLILVSWLILKHKTSDVLSFSIMLCLVLFLDPIAWQHHFVFLLFPFFVLILNIKKFSFIQKLFAFFAYILLLINFKYPNDINAFPNNLILSHDFLGNLIILISLIYIAFYNEKVNKTKL